MEGVDQQQCSSFDTTGSAAPHHLPNISPPTTAAPEAPATTIPEQYTLPHSKAIDLIGEEFVVRSLKTEPSDAATLSTEPALASSAVSRPSVVMSVSTATAQAESATPVVQAREVTDQSNLVYCNLNDLDFAAGPEGGVYTMGGSGGLSNMQEMVITSSNAGLLQMVQSVPCLQVSHIYSINMMTMTTLPGWLGGGPGEDQPILSSVHNSPTGWNSPGDASINHLI